MLHENERLKYLTNDLNLKALMAEVELTQYGNVDDGEIDRWLLLWASRICLFIEHLIVIRIGRAEREFLINLPIENNTVQLLREIRSPEKITLAQLDQWAIAFQFENARLLLAAALEMLPRSTEELLDRDRALQEECQARLERLKSMKEELGENEGGDEKH